MSKYNDTLLTTAGQALATRAANGSAKFSITRAVGSKTDLSGKTDAELVALTSLPDETQVAQIVAQVDDPDGSTGITGTQVTFQNKNEGASIDEGYTLNTIGLFAKEEGSDKETLYALTTADEADYIPDFADNVFYKFTITIYVVVGQKANVTVAIDVTGTASIEYVDSAVAKAMQNLPKDIARTGVDNKFTGANDFQKATVKGVNVATAADVDNKVNVSDMRKPASDVAGIEEVNAKQDKISYTPADDSKVVHDNHNGTIQVNGVSFTPAVLDSAAGKNSQPINTDVDTLVKPGLYYVSGSAPNNPFKALIMLENKIQYDWNHFEEIQIAYSLENKSGIAVRSVNPNGGLTGFTHALPWVFLSDDSKVAHLSGANNFDTVPTVNNNPLLLASSLPSTLADTTKLSNFTAGLQKGGVDVATTADVTTAVSTATANMVDSTKATNFTAGLKSGGVDVATAADLKSIEASAWRQLDNKYITPASGYTLAPYTNILYKIDDSNHKLYLSGSIALTTGTSSDYNIPVTIQLGSIIKSVENLAVSYLGYGDTNYLWSLIHPAQSGTDLTFLIVKGIASIIATTGTTGGLAYVTYDELV
ncbi:hypothetical protein [Secundilactobacillus muriivasis]